MYLGDKVVGAFGGDFADCVQAVLNPKKIFHVDLAAFFAAVEVLDNPKLAGKPIPMQCRMERCGAIASCISTTNLAIHHQRALQLPCGKIRGELGLSCSVGVPYNRFLTKMASSTGKQDGVYVIEPRMAKTFIAKLSVRSFYSVGMPRLSGTKRGKYTHGSTCFGFPYMTPVCAEEERKSLSRERTVAENLPTCGDVGGQEVNIGKAAAMSLKIPLKC
jgi:nucleotidyltransferase/DNA polymerase involved in DNA repair